MPTRYKIITTAKIASGADVTIGTDNEKYTTPKAIADSRIHIGAGFIMDFAGSSAPTGWLICNGATVSQTTYATLFAITGHTYGSDPGGGDFILPDARGKATVGYLAADSNFGALGNVAAGEKTHTLSAAESGLVGHNHIQDAHNHSQPYNDSAAGSTYGNSGTLIQRNADVAVTSTTATNQAVAAAAASNAHNNIQPSIVFNKIIKF